MSRTAGEDYVHQSYLRVDVRSRTYEDVQAKVFGDIEDSAEVVRSRLEVKLTVRRAVPAPVRIDGKGIEARRFDLQRQRARQSVNLPSQDGSRSAVPFA